MKILVLTCGAKVLLDDDVYEWIPKKGWYLHSNREKGKPRKTSYVFHDTYGSMHRYILGLTNPNLIVDHIDRNGLNNQRSNLRVTDTSTNKRNQSTQTNNPLHFNGVSFEKGAQRFRARWSSKEYQSEYRRYKAHVKNFPLKEYGNDPNLALRAAILYRIQMMKENDYLIDERSTTIEKILLKNEKPNMEEILGIDFDEVLK